MNRRQVFKLGAAWGGLAGAGAYGCYALLPPARSRELGSVDDLACRLFESLDPETQGEACVAYDHPLRQYHNRGVGGGGLATHAWNFDWKQRGILTDLLYAGLSEQGQERLPRQFFIRWPGVHLMKLLICGDPRNPPYQLVLSGPHLNLRLGGRNPEGVAFGGPLVYGDQRGNERPGLPGNLYQYQFETAQRLLRSLTPGQRQVAVQTRSPIQTQITLQGSAGSFPGVLGADMTQASRVLLHGLLDGILATYPVADVDYAWECIERNGGLDSLRVSYYEEGKVAGSDEYPIFRIEGPAAVFYFRGFPHVHAFLNVSMDGDRPLSVGELLGNNPAPLEGAAVQGLFERAMREQAATDFAYYAPESVAGHLREGSIRTGDIYTLESWQDSITVVEVRGANLHPAVSRDFDVDPARLYSIATTSQVATELASERLGRVESRLGGISLRDATIAYLKARGFPASG